MQGMSLAMLGKLQYDFLYQYVANMHIEYMTELYCGEFFLV